MASKGLCFYCKADSDQFVNGWNLKNGSLAQLCNKCGFAYVNGTFCETFHMEAEGWRNCAICGKLLHCGCLMSCQTYAELDFGGVGCSRCLLVVDRCIASGQMTQMLKELAAKKKTDSTVPSDPTKKVFKSFSPGSLPVPSPWFRKESNTNASKGNTACETNIHSGPQVDASIGNSICAGNMQRMTSSKQHQTFSAHLNSGHIPLFDKSSIASDVNHSKGCIVPQKYAPEQYPRGMETSVTPAETVKKSNQACNLIYHEHGTYPVTGKPTLMLEKVQKEKKIELPRSFQGFRQTWFSEGVSHFKGLKKPILPSIVQDPFGHKVVNPHKPLVIQQEIMDAPHSVKDSRAVMPIAPKEVMNPHKPLVIRQEIKEAPHSVEDSRAIVPIDISASLPEINGQPNSQGPYSGNGEIIVHEAEAVVSPLAYEAPVAKLQDSVILFDKSIGFKEKEQRSVLVSVETQVLELQNRVDNRGGPSSPSTSPKKIKLLVEDCLQKILDVNASVEKAKGLGSNLTATWLGLVESPSGLLIPGAVMIKNAAVQKKRGRPPGSKNKPKTLPTDQVLSLPPNEVSPGPSTKGKGKGSRGRGKGKGKEKL